MGEDDEEEWEAEEEAEVEARLQELAALRALRKSIQSKRCASATHEHGAKPAGPCAAAAPADNGRQNGDGGEGEASCSREREATAAGAEETLAAVGHAVKEDERTGQCGPGAPAGGAAEAREGDALVGGGGTG